MPPYSAETIFSLNQSDFKELIDSKVLMQKKQIIFYSPSSSSNDFQTISITGNKCSLKCKHCEGRLLETMRSAVTPEILYSLSCQLKKKGTVGCLISGGCLQDGTIPLKQFISTFKRIKRDLGLTLFVHCGLISQETAILLKRSGIDAALIDVISSQEIINNTLNLNIQVKDYVDSLNALHSAGLPIVPHVIVGLNEGKIGSELNTLRMILPISPAAIVIIAFMPIRGTVMEKTIPPQPLDIAKVIACAKLMFPQTPVTLGCMRPKGILRREIDLFSIKSGVDAIAFPSKEAVKYAYEQKLEVKYSSYCCAQINKDTKPKGNAKK